MQNFTAEKIRVLNNDSRLNKNHGTAESLT